MNDQEYKYLKRNKILMISIFIIVVVCLIAGLFIYFRPDSKLIINSSNYCYYFEIEKRIIVVDGIKYLQINKPTKQNENYFNIYGTNYTIGDKIGEINNYCQGTLYLINNLNKENYLVLTSNNYSYIFENISGKQEYEYRSAIIGTVSSISGSSDNLKISIISDNEESIFETATINVKRDYEIYPNNSENGMSLMVSELSIGNRVRVVIKKNVNASSIKEDDISHVFYVDENVYGLD